MRALPPRRPEAEGGRKGGKRSRNSAGFWGKKGQEWEKGAKIREEKPEMENGTLREKEKPQKWLKSPQNSGFKPPPPPNSPGRLWGGGASAAAPGAPPTAPPEPTRRRGSAQAPPPPAASPASALRLVLSPPAPRPIGRGRGGGGASPEGGGANAGLQGEIANEQLAL